MSLNRSTIETERLLLRPFRAEDAPVLLPVLEANQAHLSPWIPEHVWRPVPLPDLASRLEGNAVAFDPTLVRPADPHAEREGYGGRP